MPYLYSDHPDRQLLPNEVVTGTLNDVQGLGLLFPRNKDEKQFLVARLVQPGAAICLDPGAMFGRAFELEDDSASTGVIMNQINIELDEKSMFSPEYNQTVPGAMIRRGDQLCIAGKASDFSMSGRYIPLIDGLPECKPNLSVGFTRWSVTIGAGEQKKIMRAVDVFRDRQVPQAA